jgi:mitogen-activated protein kinase 1/3
MKEKFPGIGEDCIDLIDKMLVFNPYFRASVDECLDHPYFKKIRNPEKELIADTEIELDLEKEGDLNIIKLRELFVREIEFFEQLKQ